MRIVKEPIEFDWDVGNTDKNQKHRVENREAEEAFLDKNKVIYKDVFHSDTEERFIILGKTRNKRLLYVVFTERGERVRVISARDINRKEIPIYEKRTQTT